MSSLTNALDKLQTVLRGIDFLNKQQIQIVNEFVEDQEYFYREYIEPNDFGKLAFHFQVILQISLVKALKLSQNCFTAFGLFTSLSAHHVRLLSSREATSLFAARIPRSNQIFSTTIIKSIKYKSSNFNFLTT